MIGKVTSHMSWAIEHTITIIAAANTDFVRTMSHNNNLLQTGLCVRPWLFVDVSLLCSLSRFWCTFYAFRPLSIIIWCTWCLICCNFTSELLQLRDKQLSLKPSHFCQLTAMISLVSSCTLDSFCIAMVRCLYAEGMCFCLLALSGQHLWQLFYSQGTGVYKKPPITGAILLGFR